MKFFENWKQMNLEHQKKLIQQVDDGYIVNNKFKVNTLEDASIIIHSSSMFMLKMLVVGIVFSTIFILISININNDYGLSRLLLFTIFFLTLDKWCFNPFVKNINKIGAEDRHNDIDVKKISKDFSIFYIFFVIFFLFLSLELPSILYSNYLYKPAIRVSNLYLKIKPDSLKNYEIRGLSKAGLNDIEGAKEDFIKGYEISKKDQDKLNFLYYIINANIDLGNKKEALENLEEYKNLFSEDYIVKFSYMNKKLKSQNNDIPFFAAMLGDIESQKVISIIDKKLPKTDCNEDKNKLLFYKALMNKIINTDESLEQSINDLNLLEQNNSCKYEKAAIANMKANIYEQMGNYCKAVEEYDRACEISKKCPPINERFLYDYARYKCVKEK